MPLYICYEIVHELQTKSMRPLTTSNERPSEPFGITNIDSSKILYMATTQRSKLQKEA